jgi:hypothetical protein
VNSTVVNVASNETLVKDAYGRVKGDWAALAADQLLQVNLDIQLASQTILGALPEIRDLRERMVKELPAFDVTQFDKLEDYVLALVFVQSRYVMATQPDDDLQILFTEASKLRERLAADAQALSLRRLFDTRKLAALKGANGYKNVAHDLQALSAEFEAIWPKIEGKCPTTLDDLTAATQMSTRVTRVVGLREQSPAVLAVLTEERMRAFTLMLKVYDEARSAVSYLRRHVGDADSIAPSLYTGKSTRRKANEAEPTAPVDQAPGGGNPALAAAGGIPAPVVPAPPATQPAADGIAARGPFLA